MKIHWWLCLYSATEPLERVIPWPSAQDHVSLSWFAAQHFQFDTSKPPHLCDPANWVCPWPVPKPSTVQKAGRAGQGRAGQATPYSGSCTPVFGTLPHSEASNPAPAVGRGGHWLRLPPPARVAGRACSAGASLPRLLPRPGGLRGGLHHFRGRGARERAGPSSAGAAPAASAPRHWTAPGRRRLRGAERRPGQGGAVRCGAGGGRDPSRAGPGAGRLQDAPQAGGHVAGAVAVGKPGARLPEARGQR